MSPAPDAPRSPQGETWAFAQPSKAIGSTGWLITFADLLSLMLAFFLLMFSMSQVKFDAWRAIVDSLSERLNPSHHWTDPARTTRQNMPRTFVERAVNLDYLFSLLREDMAAAELDESVLIERRIDRIILSAPGQYLFAADDSLTDAGDRVLAAMADRLRLTGNAISVIGHAGAGDRGREAWARSIRRAEAVAAALGRLGVKQPVNVLGRAGDDRDDPTVAPERRRSLDQAETLLIAIEGVRGGGS